jgi:uncharacterized membrane protein
MPTPSAETNRGAAVADPTLFEAAIVPHRSLSARGLKVLLGLIGGLSCAGMTVLWLLGAWPVIGFGGAEIALAVLLIRLHARVTRENELLLLSERELRIVRTDARGRRQERVLQPAWLHVLLEERRGRVPALLLVARNTREEVGRRLGEAEKRDLAQALAAALHRLRHPRFDNPQLQN